MGVGNMKEKFLFKKSFYSNGEFENPVFQISNKDHDFQIPINNLNLDRGILYRFKIVIEEVSDESYYLLDSNILGEQLENQIYEKFPIDEETYFTYNHVIKGKELQENIEDKDVSYTKIKNQLSGEYHVHLRLFKKIPLSPQFISHEAPPPLTDYELKVPTITLHILLVLKDYDIEKNKLLTQTSVYGGFGHLGFFMTDLKVFSEFIRREVGEQQVNLVELFTSTELVDKCFEAGILIITWGIKPWHYYIATDNRLFNFNSKKVISGTYKLRNDIKELSIIPGSELIKWPECLKKEWPTVQLKGEGERIDFSLYLEHAIGNEIIPTYIISRTAEYITHVNPIINYNFF